MPCSFVSVCSSDSAEDRPASFDGNDDATGKMFEVRRQVVRKLGIL